MARPFINLQGLKFGRLSVIELHSLPGNGKSAKWKCLCDCGKQYIAARSALKAKVGSTVSCGCYTRERSSKQLSKHRLTGTPTYVSWNSMKNRVLNPLHDNYSSYGGRGITICDRWLNSFENFLEDMGPRPPNTTLDRINPNGNYEASNCRWSSPKQQANNRRTNKLLTIGLESMTVTQWAEKFRMTENSLSKRLKRGWSPEEILMAAAHNWEAK